jgi:hypothetical protein
MIVGAACPTREGGRPPHRLRGDLPLRSVRHEERWHPLRGQPRFEAAGLRPPNVGLDRRFPELSSDTLDNQLGRAGGDHPASPPLPGGCSPGRPGLDDLPRSVLPADADVGAL